MKKFFKKFTKTEILLFTIGLMILVKGSFYLGMFTTMYFNKGESDRLKQYEETYLYRQGGTSLCSDNTLEEMKHYKIVSLDGGQNWYEYTSDSTDVNILFKVDKGFVECLEGWDKLSAYVTESGTIEIGKDTTGMKLMEELGFKFE